MLPPRVLSAAVGGSLSTCTDVTGNINTAGEFQARGRGAVAERGVAAAQPAASGRELADVRGRDGGSPTQQVQPEQSGLRQV